MSTFASVSKQIGKVKPETKSIAQEVYEAAKKAGYEIWYIWGMGTSAEHKTGLALDLMVRNEAAGGWVRNYLWNNRSRLRLKHVIWEQHITSTVVQPGVRRKMEDRGNSTANHFDHNHVWLFEGSYRKPTSSAPKPPVPKPPASQVVKEGAKGQTVIHIQEFFRRVFPAYRNFVSVKRGQVISVDGDFGPQTTAWVKEFQERTGLKQDGEVGPLTRAKMRTHGYQF